MRPDSLSRRPDQSVYRVVFDVLDEFAPEAVWGAVGLIVRQDVWWSVAEPVVEVEAINRATGRAVWGALPEAVRRAP